MRVLLVDDSVEYLRVATKVVEATGNCRVVGTATNGEDALSRTRELEPDAVLLDFAMPGMHGLEVAARLKSLTHPPHIIMVTGYDLIEYREAAERAGADAFIVKDRLALDLPTVCALLLANRSQLQVQS